MSSKVEKLRKQLAEAEAAEKKSSKKKSSKSHFGELVDQVKVVRWFETKNDDFLRVVLKSTVGGSNYQVGNFPADKKKLLKNDSFNVWTYHRDGSKEPTSNVIMFGNGVKKFTALKETEPLEFE